LLVNNNQPPLQHPPVFQLLTDFFGQSGEKFILYAKKFGPSKMKFRGFLALKTWRKFCRRIFGLSLCFQRFFGAMQPNFCLYGTQRRTITGSVGTRQKKRRHL
jgi:hypothetical protein